MKKKFSGNSKQNVDNHANFPDDSQNKQTKSGKIFTSLYWNIYSQQRSKSGKYFR